MEFTLICNKCHTKLTSEAFITVCNHIFCKLCTKELTYWTPHELGLKCPICPTVLRRDDICHPVDLRPPSEHDKDTVLKGLSPGDVLQCATAALNFWEIQMNRQIYMKSYFSQTWENKYDEIAHELEAVKGIAERDNEMLSKKLEALTAERDDVRQRNDELLERLKEKNKRLSQVQELYDKLKEMAMLDQLQDTVTGAVDLSLRRVGVAGASPLANPTWPGLPRPAEPGTQNSGHIQKRSLPHIPSGPSMAQPWHSRGHPPGDQPHKRNQVSSGLPAHHATLNGTSGIGLPGSGIGGSQAHNGGQRLDCHRGFVHPVATRIGSGYGVNNQRRGSVRKEIIVLPD
ncbi:hypothetical protein MAPG_04993 [Magnaporthiopsis poae ATCC 64411]|uniref:RING-type domain-containing protein n=1 Tax=Magnaporthiopsis poae (strain ATCC 64411 / 73-15) TaxID=644358 RepID=A0A0C4DY82_MAGP6|nr:hypothetical protein MAPG_04993 [Magnaporthiopsis poae ATCC 64411]